MESDDRLHGRIPRRTVSNRFLLSRVNSIEPVPKFEQAFTKHVTKSTTRLSSSFTMADHSQSYRRPIKVSIIPLHRSQSETLPKNKSHFRLSHDIEGSKPSVIHTKTVSDQIIAESPPSETHSPPIKFNLDEIDSQSTDKITLVQPKKRQEYTEQDDDDKRRVGYWSDCCPCFSPCCCCLLILLLATMILAGLIILLLLLLKIPSANTTTETVMTTVNIVTLSTTTSTTTTSRTSTTSTTTTSSTTSTTTTSSTSLTSSTTTTSRTTTTSSTTISSTTSTTTTSSTTTSITTSTSTSTTSSTTTSTSSSTTKTTSSTSITTSSISTTFTTTTTTSVSTASITSNPCTSPWKGVQILYSCTNCPDITPYQQFTYTFTAVSNRTRVTFSFREDVGCFALDGVSVRNILTPGVELIANNGFETGDLTSWTYCNPSGATSAGAVKTYPNLYCEGVYYQAKTGSYFYYDGAVGSVDYLNQMFDTQIGQTYTLSYWLFNLGSGTASNANVMVSF